MSFVKKTDKDVNAQEVVQEVVAKESVKEVAPEVVATTSKPAKRKQLDKSEEVACRSVVNGSLLYISRRSHETIEWDGYGDIHYATVEELLTMKSTQGKFLTDPWLIIEDDEVIDFLGLRAIYEKIIPIDDIESFLLYSQLSELEVALTKAPKGIRELVIDKARELVSNETLYDIRIMRLLDKVLNIELTMIQN